MKYLRRSLMVMLLFPVLFLSACSSPLDSSESVVSPGLGIDLCYNCHLDTGYTFYNPSFAMTIQQIFAVWASSGHSNLETRYSASFGTTLFGFPDLDNYMDESCVPCHDPNMDSQYVAALAATGAPGGSTTLRPVVGCEACHGSGDGHINASFAVPYPAPDYDRCGQCHNSDFDHNEHHPEADNLVEDYKGSRHSQSMAPFLSFPVAPLCAACHTDEGARAYVDTDWTAIPSGDPPVSDPHPVQCRTCHDAHDPGSLYARAGGVGSEEFRLCNRCHLLDDGAGNPGVHYHENWGDEFLITDTHIAASGSFDTRGANEIPITGYAFSYTSQRPCRNCHNVHSADIEINEQWANSAHADTSAVGAWAHYNWTRSDRRDCQRCHTTTGIIEYLTTNPMAGTDYAAPLTTDNNYMPEMLHCNGCHSDNAGSLREPGPIIGDYAGASYPYPDVGGSNVCMACHIGRESGESIQNKSADFSSTGFVNSHYLSAGGTIFQATGYEYAATYANFSFYEHEEVGLIAKTSSVVGGTDKGPCVGCHLSSPESHHFLPVEHDEDGHITAVTSRVCSKCHSGGDARTPDLLQDEKELLHAALGALESAMADSTIKPAYYFQPSYPYIFSEPDTTDRLKGVVNWLSIGDTDLTGDTTGKSNMGAAYNYNLLEHDPGAFAHNSLYTRLLIFDSIDWLDNNILNGTIDLSAFPEAAEYLQRDDIAGNNSAVARPAIY